MKNTTIWILTALLTLSCAVKAQTSPQESDCTPDLTVLKTWQAGQTVSQEAVDAFGGLDSCFVSQPIPDGVWQRMQGKTFKPNPHIGRDDLRHIRALHWDYDEQTHVGEMVCNKKIAERLVLILRTLYEQHYPIERMVLPDVYNADDDVQMADNNTSCFCYRVVSGTTHLSKHALGLAIDVNTRYNPYITYRNGKRRVQPDNGADYCDRSKQFRYKIDHNDLCFKLFTQHGFRWGGDWHTSKDYQHFELIE
jgi:hypothetical protein